jgi:peptidoglycan hydrolase-like protein with peptidoglycan-binding domain
MSPSRRWGWWLALAAVVLPAGEALAGAPGTADKPTTVATVTRGALAAQLGAPGTLQYLAQPDGAPYTVVDHTTGTFTSLPAVGDVIDQGQVLYRVDDQPVLLLDGTTPAYRSLSEGDTGPDVKQLNADLVELGYAPQTQLDPDSNYFGPSTADALEQLQETLGLTQTGTLPFGQAVFLPAPIRITAVNATLGTADPISPPPPEFASLELTRTPNSPPQPSKRPKCKRRHHRHCKPAHKPPRCKRRRHRSCTPHNPHPNSHKPKPPTGHPRPAGHAPRPHGTPKHAPGSPNPNRGSPASPGAGMPAQAPARAILQATTTRREVVAQLPAAELHSVKLGQRAVITLPSQRTIAGAIIGIGDTINSSGDVAIDITLEHSADAGSLDEAPVQVQIATQSARNALRVLVTSLVAQTDGGLAVRTIDARGDIRLVPVRVGIFDDATGLIEVNGPLAPGERILQPGA